MILIAGGTGTLGTRVVRLLAARGLRVRILTRDPARSRHLDGALVEVVQGDARDPGSLGPAMQGAETVISAIQGFQGADNVSPRTVDYEGNCNLIHAATRTGVKHFIMISMHGAAPNAPTELLRMKHLAEEELKRSGLSWTIIRPTVTMQMWEHIIGDPLLETGKTMFFGRGTTPINFVSADDVAQFVELAVIDPAMRDTLLQVGGPENLTMRQVVETFQTAIGKRGTVRRVPLPMMRVMSVLARPVNAGFARMVQAGVVMDTGDMSFDASELTRRYPSIRLTTFRELAERDLGSRASEAAATTVGAKT